MSETVEPTLSEEELINQAEEQQAAQQEAYYYHVIAEFYGACKFFGTAKVMQDLKLFKETVEKPKDEPRIQLI